MKKNALSLGLNVLLLAGLISGCNGGDSSPKAESTNNGGGQTEDSGKSDNPFAEHMNITVAYPDIQNAVKAGVDDAMLKHIQDKFNITLEPVNLTWSDYGEKGKLWAASGQLPDVMFSDSMDTDLANKWADQGITRMIPKDLSAYPHVDKMINLPDVQGYFTEKGLSFLPRPLATRNELPADRTLFVRKDWMQKLGYTKDPGTYEELKKMVTDFVQNNPDGKKDVAGIAIHSSFLGDVFQNVYPQHGWWVKSGDKWIPYSITPEFVEYVKIMRDFYQAGLIDKDFAIPNQDAEGKFAQGKAGLLLFQSKNIRQVEDKWKQYNPNVKFEDSVALLTPVPASDGNQYLFSFYSFWSGTVFRADVDDKKMDRILRLYDYLLSPEGRKLTMYGFEGTDWKMEGEKLVITRPKDDKGVLPALATKYPYAEVFSSLAAWVGFEGNIYGNEDHPGESDYAYNTKVKYEEEMLKIGKPLGIDWKVNAFVSTVPRTVAKIDVNAEITKIMTGKDNDVDKLWKEVVQRIEENEKPVIDEVNKKFK